MRTADDLDAAGVDDVTQTWLSTSARRRAICSRYPAGDEGELLRMQHEWKKRMFARKGRQTWCVHQLADADSSRDQIEFCRRHGFERPFNNLQLISWIVFSIDAILGFIFLPMTIPIPFNWMFVVLFAIIILVVVTTAALVTRLDPSDPLVFLKDKELNILPSENIVPCDLCGAVDLDSKHCRSCNKCVERFDHHCKWLNNCIGRRNYMLFFTLILFVSMLSLLLIAGSVACVVYVVKNPSSYGQSNSFVARRHGIPDITFYIVVSILFLFNVPFFCLDLQLVFLHCYLMMKGWTTFEYITQRVRTREEHSSEVVCCEWIVIDRQRLKRARDKFKRKQNVSVISDPPPPPPPARVAGAGVGVKNENDARPITFKSLEPSLHPHYSGSLDSGADDGSSSDCNDRVFGESTIS